MKRIISLILVCALVLSGCAQTQLTTADTYETVQAETKDEKVGNAASEAEEENKTHEIVSQNGDIPIADGEDADPSPYEYVVDFDSLNDDELMRYVEDNIYAGLAGELDSDKYFVENVSTVYISQEYIDELAFNSQSNVYFGYSLAELDEAFQGTRYVFTLGDNGDTIVTAFEDYDETYDNAIKNVAMGTGVILVCVTVSALTGGTGATAVSMIFAASAKTGTICALSAGALSGVAAGVATGIQTKDMEQAKKAAALVGSEGFKWGAIMGVISGDSSEDALLKTIKGAIKKGLSMQESAVIQKESKYPVEVIKQFHTMEEYEVFKDANLKPYIINGKTALVRTDIDMNLVDELGRTNLQRMKIGLSPLDAKGASYELYHIGQSADATLAILAQGEHDNAVMRGFKDISEIDRKVFATQRKNFWKTMATVLESGGLM